MPHVIVKLWGDNHEGRCSLRTPRCALRRTQTTENVGKPNKRDTDEHIV